MFKKYDIQVAKIVEKFLNKHQDIAIRFIHQIEVLQKFPYKNNLDIKPLK
jgi:hypothetical protein